MSEIISIRPDLFLVEADVGDFQVRGAVVLGKERAIVWDTLARPRDMSGVAEATRHLPLSIVYSHGDWDHVWGTDGLSRPHDEILAHRSCIPRFSDELPQTLQRMRSEAPGTYDEVRLVAPTRTFQKRLNLDLGGVTLELHTLPGHTPDTVVGFLPEWGILLAGDAVETPIPFLNSETPISEWVRGLLAWSERLSEAERSLPGTWGGPLVIPSHGRIGGVELLLENARYLQDLLSGRDPSTPEDMSLFYRETHAGNRSIAAGRRK